MYTLKNNNNYDIRKKDRKGNKGSLMFMRKSRIKVINVVCMEKEKPNL